jgi:hypothetical protein
MKNYHKFVSLEEGRVIYFGDEGKLNFERTERIKAFKYVGTVTEEERAKEEAEASEPRKSHQELSKENNELVGKHKADAKELTQEELEVLASKTKSIDDDLTDAEKKQLDKDKKELAKKKKDEQKEA